MDCDIRIASRNSYFALSEVRRGIMPGTGIHWAPRLMAMGDAAMMLYTGGNIPAEEAFRMGLVQEVVEPDQLMPRSIEIAEQIGANAPLAVQGVKRMLQLWRQFAFTQSVQLAQALNQTISASEDSKEGPRAFAEKRGRRLAGPVVAAVSSCRRGLGPMRAPSASVAGRSAAPHVVFERLRDHYGSRQWTQRRGPLDELIYTVLSQNTSDANTDRTFAALRARFPDWRAVQAASPDLIADAIKPGGPVPDQGAANPGHPRRRRGRPGRAGPGVPAGTANGGSPRVAHRPARSGAEDRRVRAALLVRAAGHAGRYARAPAFETAGVHRGQDAGGQGPSYD